MGLYLLVAMATGMTAYRANKLCNSPSLIDRYTTRLLKKIEGTHTQTSTQLAGERELSGQMKHHHNSPGQWTIEGCPAAFSQTCMSCQCCCAPPCAFQRRRRQCSQTNPQAQRGFSAWQEQCNGCNHTQQREKLHQPHTADHFKQGHMLQWVQNRTSQVSK